MPRATRRGRRSTSRLSALSFVRLGDGQRLLSGEARRAATGRELPIFDPMLSIVNTLSPGERGAFRVQVTVASKYSPIPLDAEPRKASTESVDAFRGSASSGIGEYLDATVT